MRHWLAFSVLGLLSTVAVAGMAASPPADAAAMEFFEREIRPILVEKCQSCHGEKKALGGLRLTSRATLLKGGDGGPVVVPGKPGQSPLVQAVEYLGRVKMPPTGKLSATEIESLKRWVAIGAPWPTPPAGGRGQGSRVGKPTTLGPPPFAFHWAFRPVQRVPVPAVKNVAWPGNPIDSFVLHQLEVRGLKPAARAERRSLIRRVTFDLTGLPPAPEHVEAFLADSSPGAFARVVDRLLASPAYGERYARHWLDVVRYADYHDGNPQARTASCEPLQAWRYRDWVVSAFNRDLPFDRFITHQIAGDLLPSPDGQEFYADGLVATTFLTNGSWDRGDADKEKMVSDMVDDQIDTVGKAFMGLTLGCARCHDHKFDPVSQADYYGLAGVFYSTHILQDIGAKGGEYTLNRIPLAPKAFVEKRAAQLQELSQVNAKLAELDKQNPKPPADDPARVMLAGTRDRLQKELLPEPPLAEAAQEGGTRNGLFPGIQDVPIHIRGSYTRLGTVVPRRMPQFFAGDKQPSIRSGSGRLELARWVASPSNPLTARVIVNRVWQWHFGSGLVRTPNNFGMHSEPPTHRELLDWLALKFVEDGWSLKKLHRRILLSTAYQQSSKVSPSQISRDPDNLWLGRFSPRRLEAEAIRDSMLAVAGRLDMTQGGPAGADLNVPRRSLYVQTARWDRGSFAILFDAANPDASEEKRNVSTVAPQALFLLNHEFVRTQARHFAERLAREAPGDDAARLQRAYLLLFSRPATVEELRIGLEFLQQAHGAGRETAWKDLGHVLLSSNEAAFLD